MPSTTRPVIEHARLVGWQVERVTDQELAEDFNGTIDQIVALHRQRQATFAAA
jgi:very-short-patch-repair endonuclease